MSWPSKKFFSKASLTARYVLWTYPWEDTWTGQLRPASEHDNSMKGPILRYRYIRVPHTTKTDKIRCPSPCNLWILCVAFFVGISWMLDFIIEISFADGSWQVIWNNVANRKLSGEPVHRKMESEWKGLKMRKRNRNANKSLGFSV